jgi:putative CRISPR-associated protein (TIGR02620 family)
MRRNKMKEIKIELIVTRHSALVDYLKEIGLAGDGVEVAEHATPEMIAGKNVAGVLPHSLSCLTASFTEVPLNLTPEMRGKELDLDDLRKVAGEPVTYIVRKIAK